MKMKTMKTMNMLDPFGKGFLPGQVKPPTGFSTPPSMMSSAHLGRSMKTNFKSSAFDLIHHPEDGSRQDN